MNDSSNDRTRFGTVRGVLIPNITMMFGVILFLRLGVITATAGIWTMLMVIGFSLLIMLLTSFSIGSLATNMRVGDGGVYYIISRTLGIEVGGAIGVAIYFAQLISIALTVSGFGVSFCELFPDLPLPAVELVTLGILALLSGVSAAWALQMQMLILVLLIASIGSVFLGSATHIAPLSEAAPFYGTAALGFWGCFSMFYPALTGIEAGMAMSGALKEPGKSLFYGNLYSLCFVAFSYTLLSLFAFSYVPANNLISDPFVLIDFAFWPSLVRAGIWGATLSSALGCLLGAPRMLQSMAQDGIISDVFARVSGRHEEPRVALVATTVTAGVVMLLTTIDQIIPMLTMICLISYGLLNFVAAFSELMSIPSWRPSYRVPWYFSLAALAMIILAMFMVAPGWAFITLLALTGLYTLLRSRDVESGFEDLRDSFIFFISRLTLYRLQEGATSHALTWHPQILSLLPAPQQGLRLTHVSHSLTRRSGILTFVTVIPEEWGTQERLQSTRAMLNRHFEELKVACLSDVYPCEDTFAGYQQLIKAYGIGRIQPNTVAFELPERTIDDRLLELIDTCRLMEKNVLFLQDNPEIPASFFRSRAGSKRKRIDIWWNPDETQAFDLVWSLVTTLLDGHAFQGAKVTVKTTASDENAKESISSYLEGYLEQSRLVADVCVYLDGEPLDKLAPLSLICLSALPEDAGEEERLFYLDHLRSMSESLSNHTVSLFVTAYDNVDHRAIYVQESSEATPDEASPG